MQGIELVHDMGGAKRMGGGKRTEQRTLQKISGPLEMSVWSGQFAFPQGQQEQRHQTGVENVPNEGGPNSLFGGVSFVRFSSPLLSPHPHGVV